MKYNFYYTRGKTMPGKSENFSGIIIKLFSDKEADKTALLITQTGEKIKFRAKGVRKNSSKMAFAIDLGNFVDIKVIGGYSNFILTDINLKESFQPWKKTYFSSLLLQLMLEVTSNFSLEDHPDPEIFSTLIGCITQYSIKDIINLTSSFILKMLRIQGFLPELEYYVDTQDEVVQGEIYTGDNIGFTRNPVGINVADINFKVMKFLLENDYKKIMRLTQNVTSQKEIFKICLIWSELAIENALKTKPFILNELVSFLKDFKV